MPHASQPGVLASRAPSHANFRTLHPWAAGALLLLVPALGLPAEAQTGADTPATRPAEPAAEREAHVKKMLDMLEATYVKPEPARYWVSRAMGVVSLARSPRPSATSKLFEILEKDAHDVVRLLAWEALLARAGEMDLKAFRRFSFQTCAMADKGLFRGPMRVPLLRTLACIAPTDRTRLVWQKIFTETNAWEPQDIPILDALGYCLREWKSPILYQGVINLLTNKDHAVRADYVLQRAGCTAPAARSLLSPSAMDPFSQNRVHPDSESFWRNVRAGYEKWFAENRKDLKEPRAIEDPVWRDLQPSYIAAPMPLADIDPLAKFWTRDFEIGIADTSQIEVCFVVDATGSMGDVHDWLRADIARMARCFQILCKEPIRMGITFYRDKFDPWVVQQHKLTSKLADLEAPLKAITADGGGDIPEAVYEGLREAIEKNPWGNRAGTSSKTIILLGDAPPHPERLEDCKALARRAAENKVRIHAARITTVEGRNNLDAFDEIARATGGSTVSVHFGDWPFHFLMPSGKPIPYKPLERPEVQTSVATYPGAIAGDEILILVLADIISPQYRDRVEPAARTLAAYCQANSEAEVRQKFPANTPPVGVGKLKMQ